jgi:hypothetical protein
MPDLVAQDGGTLVLTLLGVKTVEAWADLPQWRHLEEEATENIKARRDILEEAACRAAGRPVTPADHGENSPRGATNTALLSREGLIAQDADREWVLTRKGADTLQNAGGLQPVGAL